MRVSGVVVSLPVRRIGTPGVQHGGTPGAETAVGASVSGFEAWYAGISPEHQAMVDDIERLLAWGVRVSGSVNAAFCDAVLERCGLALQADPRLIDFVGYVHGIANAETSREFEAHGPTTKARLWAGLGDRLEQLTGRDAPEGR